MNLVDTIKYKQNETVINRILVALFYSQDKILNISLREFCKQKSITITSKENSEIYDFLKDNKYVIFSIEGNIERLTSSANDLIRSKAKIDVFKEPCLRLLYLIGDQEPSILFDDFIQQRFHQITKFQLIHLFYYYKQAGYINGSTKNNQDLFASLTEKGKLEIEPVIIDDGYLSEDDLLEIVMVVIDRNENETFYTIAELCKNNNIYISEEWQNRVLKKLTGDKPLVDSETQYYPNYSVKIIGPNSTLKKRVKKIDRDFDNISEELLIEILDVIYKNNINNITSLTLFKEYKLKPVDFFYRNELFEKLLRRGYLKTFRYSRLSNYIIDNITEKGIEYLKKQSKIKIDDGDFPSQEKENVINSKAFATSIKSTVPPCFDVKNLANLYYEQIDNTDTADVNNINFFGIFGQWGRGKTYFFNIFKEKIQAGNLEIKMAKWTRYIFTLKLSILYVYIVNLFAKKKIKRTSRRYMYDVVEFNAWKYQETPAIWAYLFETISISFKSKYKRVKFKKKKDESSQNRSDKDNESEYKSPISIFWLFIFDIILGPILHWLRKIKYRFRKLNFWRKSFFIIYLCSSIGYSYNLIKHNLEKNNANVYISNSSISESDVSLVAKQILVENAENCYSFDQWVQYIKEFSLDNIIAIIGLFLFFPFLSTCRKIFNDYDIALELIRKYTKGISFEKEMGVQAEIEKELEKLLVTWIPIKSKKENYTYFPERVYNWVYNTFFFRENHRKIILYIDDIDRCNETKMITIVDSLRTILENHEIRKRLVVICSIDEQKLMKGLEAKFQDLYGNSSQKLKEIICEQMDKIFLSGLKFPTLQNDHLCEFVQKMVDQGVKGIINNDDLNSTKTSMESDKHGSDVSLIQEDEEQNPKIKPNEIDSSQDGSKQNTTEKKEDIKIEAVSATGKSDSDEKYVIKELNREVYFKEIGEMLKSFINEDVVSNEQLTPRRVRIIYYRMLFANLILHTTHEAEVKDDKFDRAFFKAIFGKSCGKDIPEDTKYPDIIKMVVPYSCSDMSRNRIKVNK